MSSAWRASTATTLFARDEVREALAEQPGTYLLTDFLARTFEHTVVRELGPRPPPRAGSRVLPQLHARALAGAARDAREPCGCGAARRRADRATAGGAARGQRWARAGARASAEYARSRDRASVRNCRTAPRLAIAVAIRAIECVGRVVDLAGGDAHDMVAGGCHVLVAQAVGFELGRAAVVPPTVELDRETQVRPERVDELTRDLDVGNR